MLLGGCQSCCPESERVLHSGAHQKARHTSFPLLLQTSLCQMHPPSISPHAPAIQCQILQILVIGPSSKPQRYKQISHQKQNRKILTLIKPYSGLRRIQTNSQSQMLLIGGGRSTLTALHMSEFHSVNGTLA